MLLSDGIHQSSKKRKTTAENLHRKGQKLRRTMQMAVMHGEQNQKLYVLLVSKRYAATRKCKSEVQPLEL